MTKPQRGRKWFIEIYKYINQKPQRGEIFIEIHEPIRQKPQRGEILNIGYLYIAPLELPLRILF